MKPIVFVGPTLSHDEVRSVLDAEIRPPVSQGDVYRVALQRPASIGIIDGYFEGVPSVMHKEIQWALSEGVPVFGSASMGALRAAELSDVGMQGLGRIFESYRDRLIEDDDEVAVLHAPAELGYKSLTVPMVSIRATVDRALAGGILAQEYADLIKAHAKALHYSQRDWKLICASVREKGGPLLVSETFQAWLPANFVDPKREDALEMLVAMRSAQTRDGNQGEPDLGFEWTDVWNDVVARVQGDRDGPVAHDALGEARLCPALFEQVRHKALQRRFAIAEARRRGLFPDKAALRHEMDLHRREHGLWRKHDLEQWLADNDLDEAGYEIFLTQQWQVRNATRIPQNELDRFVLDELKQLGKYTELKQRAHAKQTRLSETASDATLSNGARDLELLSWYFANIAGRPMPDDVEEYAGDLGFSSRQELIRVLRDEYQYRLIEGET